jgi:hypothetical protein
LKTHSGAFLPALALFVRAFGIAVKVIGGIQKEVRCFPG